MSQIIQLVEFMVEIQKSDLYDVFNWKDTAKSQQKKSIVLLFDTRLVKLALE